jgi:hypothetical protein
VEIEREVAGNAGRPLTLKVGCEMAEVVEIVSGVVGSQKAGRR